MNRPELMDEFKKFYDDSIVSTKNKQQLYSLGMQTVEMLQGEAKKLVASKDSLDILYRDGLIEQANVFLKILEEKE